MRTPTKKLFFSAGFAAAALVVSAPEALAVDWVIKSPSAHPNYRAELEPHLNILFYRAGWGRNNYRGYRNHAEFGGGFRASIELADPAFIPRINNTIAITFGIDTNSCRWGCRDDFEFWSPVALQWNFFLTRKWSVFGEAGLVINSDGFFSRIRPDPVFFVGGRFHFNDKIALTMRAGSPWISVGLSFFVGN